ncbi:hypothetical protein HK099_004345 [Clydaea vesicula]|uniref:DNA-directed DNA polymerase n=1 Tax=Clydaea vesicula TaxID=447962 RepID=A0AAD5XZP4_9FUNG|nr:hypothetical protein HK099_004345 [Clydaea vesicula]
MLLPNSLRDLCNSMQISYKKGFFPYTFPNASNLNYIGITPIDHFNQEDKIYVEIVNNWSLKNETIKYLHLDLMALYNILFKVSKSIYNKFYLNITSSVSLPSLAMKEGGYYGGLVDVYETFGENLFYYDVNSLYPFAMLKDMPVGNPVEPVRKSKLITPLGEWEAWYLSEELKAALNANVGYEIIEIIEGVQFERNSNIFKTYINDFYSIKVNSKGAERNLAKLFLNSLYGRMGIKPIDFETIFINKKDFNPNLSILSVMELDNHLLIDLPISYYKSKKPLVNIAIAGAITAYSRMHINKFKNIPNNKCYYTDTDSVILEKELSKDLISKKLGDMK